MKDNINLGNKSKFVPYGSDGIKNCLEDKGLNYYEIN